MEDLYNKWPHRWITSKAEVRESNICGLGIFSKEDIIKGEVIGVIGGVVIPVSEVKEYIKTVGDFGTLISDDFWMGPSSKEEVENGGSFNHSCEPNIGFNGEIILVAINDIKKGDELTADYGFYHSIMDIFECNCGSDNCRKTITKDDWKIKELQEKYGEYFAPYLKEKFCK